MKKLSILTAILFSGAVLLNGQQNIGFTYDAAGNRIQQKVITLKSIDAENEELSSLQNPTEVEKYTDYVGSREVIIYPNPTKGLLILEVNNIPVETNLEIMLFDLQGKLLLHQTIQSPETEVDLNSQPAGTYILKLTEGNNISEWKIIKE